MLADALVLGPSGPEPGNLECLAQAHCLTSVSYRLSGDFEGSTEAARKLVQLGQKHGQSELEACGEILIASVALARAEPTLSSTQISMKLKHVQLLQRGSALQQAAASAERAWHLSGSWPCRSSLQISLRGAALLRLSQAALQGQDATALARQELRSLRGSRCQALQVAAITALGAAQLPRVEEALARLRTFGREAEGARMEVAFMAAKYWKSMGNGLDQDETDLELENWDKATAYLQQALSLARARQDFISEAHLHEQFCGGGHSCFFFMFFLLGENGASFFSTKYVTAVNQSAKLVSCWSERFSLGRILSAKTPTVSSSLW